MITFPQEAVDWLSSQPYVQPGGICSLGVCKGGEMATAMAVHFPHKVIFVRNPNPRYSLHLDDRIPYRIQT